MMKTELRPTPEVNAHRDDMNHYEFDEELALTYELAKKLERERDSAKTLNRTLLNRTLLDQLEAKDAELDANGLVLQKLQDERDAYIDKFERAEKQLEAMRDAIKEAYESLNVSTTFGTTPRQDQVRAKLQPFIKP